MKIGILGTGAIAHKMAKTVKLMGEELYAVGSRSQDKADAFKSEMGVEKAYGSYEALVSDPALQLVYIAVPHPWHAAMAKLCLQHGKHVLCEKPFTVNAREAKDVFALAEQKGLLCTEAIWTRYEPSRGLINDIIHSGEIGDVRLVTANLAYQMSHKQRVIDPALAGGALLDVGIYALNFMLMVLGDGWLGVQSQVTKDASGLDELACMTFTYPHGVMASLFTGYSFASDRRGIIYGTKGAVQVDNVNNPERIRIYDTKRMLVREVPVPPQLTGFEYEVAAARKAIEEGRTECDEMPHGESLRVMELMDALRDEWGVTYPFEK